MKVMHVLKLINNWASVIILQFTRIKSEHALIYVIYILFLIHYGTHFCFHIIFANFIFLANIKNYSLLSNFLFQFDLVGLLSAWHNLELFGKGNLKWENASIQINASIQTNL